MSTTTQKNYRAVIYIFVILFLIIATHQLIYNRHHYISATPLVLRQLLSNPEHSEPPIFEDVLSRSACHVKKKHYMLSKVEKTGTSTLYTIFARFIRFNQLNMVIQTKGWHIYINGEQGAIPGWQIGPNRTAPVDALIDHVVWNDQRIRSLMPLDTAYIVSVREPISHFKSVCNFFRKYTKRLSLEKIIDNSTQFNVERRNPYEHEMKTVYRLPQLAWLGLSYDDFNNMERIKEVIWEAVNRYEIIILNDKFEASLVLMKRKFCWDYLDIVFKSANTQNSQRSKKQSLSQEYINKLLSKERNLGDLMLYEAMKRKWYSDPIVNTEDFWNEVAYFSQLNSNVTGPLCQQVLSGQNVTLPASQWSGPLKLKKELCADLKKSIYSIHSEMGHYSIGYSPV